MPDEFDRASEREDQERERAVQAARLATPADKQRGPATCPRCGGRNNRAGLGYATCSDCIGG